MEEIAGKTRQIGQRLPSFLEMLPRLGDAMGDPQAFPGRILDRVLKIPRHRERDPHGRPFVHRPPPFSRKYPPTAAAPQPHQGIEETNDNNDVPVEA